MAKWIDGLPTKEGLFFLRMADQGGWPFVEFVEVKNIDPRTLSADFAALARAQKLDIVHAPERQLMVMRSLNGWSPCALKSLWNCSHHIPVEPPSLDLTE